MDGPLDLYERDFYAWTLQQAEELRALAATRPNLPLDLEHLAEEVEDMGSERYFQVESNLANILVHLILIVSVPGSLAVGHWRDEIRTFHRTAQRRFTRAMAKRLAENWGKVWRQSVGDSAARLSEYRNRLAPVPTDPPITPDDLLSDPIDVDALVARIRTACEGP
jgi:hypothetical protein